METTNKKLGCVYFIKHNNFSPIKIGYSTEQNPKKRLNNMSVCSPYGLSLLGLIVCEHPLKAESYIHKLYSDYRLNGEWYDINEEDVKFIVQIFENSEDRLFYLNENTKKTHVLVDFELSNYFINNITEHKKYKKRNITNDISKRFNNNFYKGMWWKMFKLFCEANGYSISRYMNKKGYFYISSTEI